MLIGAGILGIASALLLTLGPVRSTPPGPVASAAADASPPELLRKIEAGIGKASCREDSHCRSLPLGARACGGPETYRAYSLLYGDAATLQQLARDHALARRAQIKDSGRVGICQVLADPGAHCDHQQQRCVLRDPR